MRTVAACLALSLVATAPAVARWVAFDGDAVPNRPPILHASGGEDRFTVDVTIPGIEIRSEGPYDVLRIPGHAISRTKHAPEVPILTTSVMLTDRGMPSIRLVDFEERTLRTRKLAPARGRVSRKVPLSAVPRSEGTVYRQDAFFPSATYDVQVGSPYICRDVRGAAVRLCPVRYNPVAGELKILTRARFEVENVVRSTSTNPKKLRRAAIDSDFAPLYRRLFVNHEQAMESRGRLDETRGRAVVICPDAWAPVLEPLQAWRATKGLDSKLVTVSDLLAWAAGGEPGAPLSGELLKAYLKSEYEAGNLTWVLLVGDAEILPPLFGVFEGAHSDNALVRLEGEDIVPDAFISRFSCKTADELAVMVTRTVAYESRPVTGPGAACYRKAVGIGSGEGDTPDYDLVEALRQAELAWRFDHVDQIYDPRMEMGDGGGDYFIENYYEVWLESAAYQAWIASDEFKAATQTDYDPATDMFLYYQWAETDEMNVFYEWLDSDDFQKAKEAWEEKTGEHFWAEHYEYEVYQIWKLSGAFKEWMASPEYKKLAAYDPDFDEEQDIWGYVTWMELHDFAAWLESDDYATAESTYYSETYGDEGDEPRRRASRRGRRGTVDEDSRPGRRLLRRLRRDDEGSGEDGADRPYATPEMVIAAVNDGRSLINYVGHGSEYEWVTSAFGTNHMAELKNVDGAWPMIWSVACVNGAFAGEYGDCFAEAWLKAGTPQAPNGAIGMVAASANMDWIPPTVWQKAIIEDYMIPELVFTAGAQHYFGLLKTCEQYGYAPDAEGNQLVEQCIFFGDSSVTLRNDVPRVPAVTVESVNARDLVLHVAAEGGPVRAARVVVAGDGATATGLTDGQGRVSVAAFGLTGAPSIRITVTGPNLVPLVDKDLSLAGTGR